MTNQELLKQAQEMVRKGIIDTSALATGGKLNAEQSSKMIDFVFDETQLRGIARLVKMKAEQYDIDRIGVGKRVARAKIEGVDPAVRRGVTLSKISLNKKTIMVPFELTTEFMEDNIEGMSVEDHVAKMMAKAFANDLENMYISADSLGPAVPEEDIIEGGSADFVVDDILGLMDGWMKLAQSGNVFDAQGSGIGHTLFSAMKKQLPTKYRKNIKMMRFFLPMDTEETYRAVLASRGTALGDRATQDEIAPKGMGVSLQGLALLEARPLKVAHVTLTGTSAVQLNGDTDITDVVAHLQTLAATPTPPLDLVGDLVVDEAAGTIARTGGSGLSDPVNVKVTYRAQTEILLTEGRNLILGIGRDITIRNDFDIYRDVKQWAMTVRVAVNIENEDALVLGKNIVPE